MLIFPAIDLYGGKVVRLYRGDYENKTVYGDDPTAIAEDFVTSGAKHIHLVDLEGAKTGDTPAFDTIRQIKRKTGLFCEVGGGVRNIETIKRYIDAGVDRVILGTAAVTDPKLISSAVEMFQSPIAVGIDIKDGCVAIRGWTEKTSLGAFEFCKAAEAAGVKTVICTDVSKDGAMRGTNRELYKKLVDGFGIDFIASGGVSTLDDVIALRDIGLYGAIIGKAYYTGAISLKEAIEVAK